MKIVVIYKWAPDPQNAVVTDDGTIDWGVKRAISEYDPVAMSAARIFADSVNAIGTAVELIGLTAGDSSAASPKATQAAASRGLDSLVVISDDSLVNASANIYAHALAAGIAKIGDVDLIIAGDASADIGAQVVPGLLAGYLGLPSFADVNKIESTPQGVQIERHISTTKQTILLNSPAVIAVSTDAAPIPLIGMKDMIAARKKPVTKLALSDLGISAEIDAEKTATNVIQRTKPEVKPRKQIIFDSDNAAAELVAALRAEGVIS